MLDEILVRFLMGGVVVCAFAVLADVLKPKLFAGIFGAAPSVALATLGLTFASHGGPYAGLEGRSMVVGAIALLAYSVFTGHVLMRERAGTVVVAGGSMAMWLVVAFALWTTVLR